MGRVNNLSFEEKEKREQLLKNTLKREDVPMNICSVA